MGLEYYVGKSDEVEVCGVLLFVLRIKHLFGIAPLKFRKCGSNYYVSMSRSCTNVYLTPLLATIFCTAAFVGLIWDFSVEDSMISGRISSDISGLFWVLDLGVTSVVYCLGTCCAPQRMRRFIFYLNYIKKINCQLVGHEGKSGGSELYEKAKIILNLLTLTTAICIHFCHSLWIEFQNHNHLIILFLYASIYPGYYIGSLMGISFGLIVRDINSLFNSLNNRLENVVEYLENGTENVKFDIEHEYKKSPKIHLSWKLVNKVTDYVASVEEDIIAKPLIPTKENEKNLAQLLILYSRICDVMSLINKSEGPLILVIFISFIFYIETMIYDLVTIMILSDGWREKKYILLINSLWCSFVVVNMMTILNSCQRTTTEIEHTKALLSRRMWHMRSSDGHLLRAMNMFFCQLQILNPYYSPMGLFTLKRSFILTVIGVVTSYVIVFTEFRFDSSAGLQ